MTTLQFKRIQPEGKRQPQLIYGASTDQFTFVITLIENGAYHASVKHVGAKAFDGTRQDLGYWPRFVDAAKACEEYAVRNVQ